MITFDNLKIPQCMKCNIVSGYITIIFSKEMKRAGVQDRKKEEEVKKNNKKERRQLEPTIKWEQEQNHENHIIPGICAR